MIYILTIRMDIGCDTYYCSSMTAVENVVFDCFTDWDINTDTIEDIDDHLREHCEGSIIVEIAKLIGE